MRWQLQDAKNRFSEVVECALSEGPQTVTKQGRDAVMVVSVDHYRRLIGAETSFKDYLMQGPSLEGVDLARDMSPARIADLSTAEQQLAETFGLPQEKELFEDPRRWSMKEARKVIDELRGRRRD